MNVTRARATWCSFAGFSALSRSSDWRHAEVPSNLNLSVILCAKCNTKDCVWVVIWNVFHCCCKPDILSGGAGEKSLNMNFHTKSAPCTCVSIIKGGKEIAKSLKSNMAFGGQTKKERKEERHIFTIYFARQRREVSLIKYVCKWHIPVSPITVIWYNLYEKFVPAVL